MKLNIYIWLIIIELNFITIRATASTVVKSCIIQIVHHFAHFNPKNAHISQYKSVQICTITIVTMHIYTVTVALPFNILVFVSLSSLYLWLTSLSFSHFLSHLTLTDQISHFIKSTLSSTHALLPICWLLGCLFVCLFVFFFFLLVFCLIVIVGRWVFGLISLFFGLCGIRLVVGVDLVAQWKAGGVDLVA